MSAAAQRLGALAEDEHRAWPSTVRAGGTGGEGEAAAIVKSERAHVTRRDVEELAVVVAIGAPVPASGAGEHVEIRRVESGRDDRAREADAAEIAGVEDERVHDDSGIVEPRTHIVACSTETRGVERASEIVSRTRSSQTSG